MTAIALRAANGDVSQQAFLDVSEFLATCSSLKRQSEIDKHLQVPRQC